MRKGIWGMLALTIMVALVVSLLPGAAGAQVIRLKYACFFPPVHKCGQLTEQWCREVEKRTNNKVKITYLGGATLVPAPRDTRRPSGG